jgi:TolB-like protein/tetratricopeptide (TPR) repeat protein
LKYALKDTANIPSVAAPPGNLRVDQTGAISLAGTGPNAAGERIAWGPGEVAADISAPFKCIAVMPFENFSGDRDNDYFTLGVVEDLITDLAHFPNLSVISSYTSSKLGSTPRDVLQAAKELHIDYLLTGNLRHRSDQIRISVQLMSTSDGSILWAERYDQPVQMLFEIQDDIVARVVGAISAQIDKVLLAAARNKPLTSLAAYDCWLRGMDQLRQGKLATDRKARKIFEQALAIDPNYNRAYAGISLSYFNDWSCQLWDQWEATERNAYAYAMQALRLDDSDYIVQWILGRILLYRRQFDLAEQHLNRSLSLNANDAESLVQIAIAKSLLGNGPESEQLYQKALRLNPYRGIWYHPYGAVIAFNQRRYQKCIDIALKGPLTDVWIDLPVFLAAAYAHTDNLERAHHFLRLFLNAFQKEITHGQAPPAEDVVKWLHLANPFRNEADFEHLVKGLMRAGWEHGRKMAQQLPQTAVQAPEPLENEFRQENRMWRMAYARTTVQMPDAKGFHDLAILLVNPRKEIHCMDIMGSTGTLSDADMVIDAKARRAYEQRIRDLRDAIDEAESMNDLERADRTKQELDQMVEHLAKTMGLGGRTRKSNAPAERARAAVTWRIRSAIRKIDTAHPALGRHLSNAIRTGTFCSYTPERPIQWRT